MTCAACIRELEFRARIKKVHCASKSGGGISARRRFKTASSAAVNTCLFYWTCVKYDSYCEMFAFCLLSHFSVFMSGCEQLHWNSLLKKQAILNFYLGIIQWLDILGASQLIFKVFLLGYGQAYPIFSWPIRFQDPRNSNNSRKVLVTKLFFCIWIYVHRSHISM